VSVSLLFLILFNFIVSVFFFFYNSILWVYVLVYFFIYCCQYALTCYFYHFM